jgi:hypothetical protein
MERPKRSWFSQLLEDEQGKELARNIKVKAEDFSTVDPENENNGRRRKIRIRCLNSVHY